MAACVIAFFAFSGLAVFLLILSAFGGPPLWGASAISLALAFVVPVVVWLAFQPSLRRQRAAEAEQWSRISAQYEAERARRAAYYEQVQQERLRALRENRAARAASYADDPPRATSLADGHAAPVYYEILGIAVSASAEDVEVAYRREMREHHPDRGGESRRAQLINEAYETLRDPAKRRQYDRENGLR
jgi:ABC-type multidrug transport system fused ATPase/permease subunit